MPSTRKLGLLAFLPLRALAQPQPDSTTFHSGTRLVEVEVIVRGDQVTPRGLKASLGSIFDSGPPFGPPGPLISSLTKDDFALFDDGRPAEISLFRAGPSSEIKALPIPPGAVSNRQDGFGRPLNGATVLLADFLNTRLDFSDYARMGMFKLLHSLSESDNRVAVYSLGQNLHILQDFTDDPHKLIDEFAEMYQPHGRAPPALASALEDRGATLVTGVAAARNPLGITDNALRLIAQHLAGVPGRKNLIWLRMPPLRSGVIPLSQGPASPAVGAPSWASKQVMDLLRQSNIAIYPVMVRSVMNELSYGPFTMLDIERSAKNLAESTGGRAFFDALDLPSALRAAEEDAQGAYALGYYPPEKMLDDKYHNITVRLKDRGLAGMYEVHFRPGYLASKIAETPAPPSLAEVFSNPLPATNIGLIARAIPDAEQPGLYNLELTVDLRDIHMEHKDGFFTGAFDIVLPDPSESNAVQVRTITVNLPEAQFARALESGASFRFGAVAAESGQIRVAVRDDGTSLTGLLRVSVQESAAK